MKSINSEELALLKSLASRFTIAEAIALLIHEQMHDAVMPEPGSSIRRWLFWAKATGKPWADRAIANTENPDAPAKNMADAVDVAFLWRRSPEGRAYWSHVFNNKPGDPPTPMNERRIPLTPEVRAALAKANINPDELTSND